MDAIVNNVLVGLSNLWSSMVNAVSGAVGSGSLLNNLPNNLAWDGPVFNNYYYVIVGIVAIFLIYKLISIPFKLVLNGVLGCVMLMGVNWVGSLVNFMVPVNIITALIAGILGIPGIVGIVLYYAFFVRF